MLFLLLVLKVYTTRYHHYLVIKIIFKLKWMVLQTIFQTAIPAFVDLSCDAFVHVLRELRHIYFWSRQFPCTNRGGVRWRSWLSLFWIWFAVFLHPVWYASSLIFILSFFKSGLIVNMFIQWSLMYFELKNQ